VTPDDIDSVISEAPPALTGAASGRTNYPKTIGPYRIIRVLGEGGMGTVYEAADTGPVRRHVALKVVRGGINSAEVRSRFNAERQALALMDHAGIAKVLQAGETENGDPFFAMELVKGLIITDYCDSKRLSTTERLKLFVEVCQAVQHAHQKGVIHRDLKPSNVMITEQDGEPVPKIIDFGIAKALGLQLTDNTLVTQVGQPLGTAAYMSPEQAESSGMDVDTRSDIYSLGVILYTILVGSLPVDPTGLPMHAFIYRLASKDTRAPRPSTRYTGLGDFKQGIAQARRTDPDHLVRELSGDLDWIVMKALEPERSRRYDTAIGLATDIERFLAHQTVTARPPTTAYRVQKFIRRHRAAVAGTSITVLAIIVSAILATAGMVRATRAERKAANEAAAAKQVSDFLVALFKVSEPSEANGNAVTARSLLDRGAAQAATDLARQPALQSRMLNTIGTAYSSLGLYDAARAQLEKALEARIALLGPNDPAVAESELALGDAMASHGDADLAEKHYQRALAINEKAFGPEDARVGRVLSSIAALRFVQGRVADAEPLYKRAIAISEKTPEESDQFIAQDLLGLGSVYWAGGRFAEAEQFIRRSLAVQERRLGPNHPDLASVLNNLGALYWTQGRYSDALPLYDRTRVIFERTLDPMHPNMASILNNLGETYWKLKRFREADSLFRRALTIKEARLTRDNPSIAVTLNGLAGSLRDQGKYPEAETAYQRALEIRKRGLAQGDPNIAETVRDYGVLLRATGRAGQAESLARDNGVKIEAGN
jgi:non-specific serine/threonine protein kinase/serine/threonine-protein kinase